MLINLAARLALYALLYALQGNSRWRSRCAAAGGCSDCCTAQRHPKSRRWCYACGRCGLCVGRVSVSALYSVVFLLPSVWWMVGAAYDPPQIPQALQLGLVLSTAPNATASAPDNATAAGMTPTTVTATATTSDGSASSEYGYVCTSTADPNFAQCLRYWLIGSTAVNEWLLWCFTFTSMAQAVLYTCLSAVVPDRPPTKAVAHRMRIAALVAAATEELRKEHAKSVLRAAALKCAGLSLGLEPGPGANGTAGGVEGLDRAGAHSPDKANNPNPMPALPAAWTTPLATMQERARATDAVAEWVQRAEVGYGVEFPLCKVSTEDDDAADRARTRIPCALRLRQSARAATSVRRVVASLYAAFSLMSASDAQSAVYHWGVTTQTCIFQVLFYDALCYDLLMLIDEFGGKRARQLRNIFAPLRGRLYPSDPRIWAAAYPDEDPSAGVGHATDSESVAISVGPALVPLVHGSTALVVSTNSVPPGSAFTPSAEHKA